MTREEKKNALHCLKVMIDEEVCEECDLYGTTGTDHCEADCVRVAIEALEQKPSNDTVSCGVFEQAMWERDVAITQLKELGYGLGEKPKTGHWIHFAASDDCSECRWSTGKYISPSKYCPNCGAKMVEPQEGEEE